MVNGQVGYTLTKSAKRSIWDARLDSESASVVPVGLTDSNFSGDWFAMVVFPLKKKNSVYAALIYYSTKIIYYSLIIIYCFTIIIYYSIIVKYKKYLVLWFIIYYLWPSVISRIVIEQKCFF